MKKSLIALAVLATTGAAMAQSSVTLYGRLDASIGQTTSDVNFVNPVTPDTTNDQTKIDNSQLNTTFWGMKGTEDLGGGLKANFKLESGFALDTGVGNAGIFERTATVGLSGGFGDVNLGRQYTAYDALRGATNNVWDSNMATTGAVWTTGVKDYSNRISNSIRYDSPSFSGISGSVAYGFGEDKNLTSNANPLALPPVANTNNLGDATDNVSLHIKYVAGPLLVGYAHQEETQAKLTAAAQDTNKYDLFGASYDFGVAKITGSYNMAENNAAEDEEYQLGVSVPMGAFAFAAGYSKSTSDSKTPGVADLNGEGYTLVGTYNMSKRTTLYVGYKSTEVESATATTEASTFAAGVRHTF